MSCVDRWIEGKSEPGGPYISSVLELQNSIVIRLRLEITKLLLNIFFSACLNLYFRFDTFELEYHTSCIFDYVQLFDGTDFSTPLTQPLCGSTVPQGFFHSTGNSMLINMVTDYSVTQAGFSGAYLATYGKFGGIQQGMGIYEFWFPFHSPQGEF